MKSRVFQYLNLLGIILLAVLCCVQWRTNRLLNLQMIDLENTSIQQSAKIAEQDKEIKGYAADLEDFRQRLELSESAMTEVEEKLTTATEEKDQLKIALNKWIAAVDERDAALKQANEQVQKLSAERNDAMSKFNDLAEKYNTVVKDLNNSRSE